MTIFWGERFPYSFSSHVKLIERLEESEPKIVNYFINFDSPETPIEKTNLKKFANKITAFQDKGMRFRLGTQMDSWGEILPPEDLRKVGFSLSLLNVDSAIFAKDDICRRAILNISGDSSLHLWTANEYKKSIGSSAKAGSDYWGSYYNADADATFALFRFSTSTVRQNDKIKRIPFHRVLVGNFQPDLFKDKIVLIGPEYSANPQDYIATPFSKQVLNSSKMNVHAAIIEALIADKTVWQLPKYISNVLCLIVAILLSYFISKYNPTKGLIVTIATMVLFVVLGFTLFSLFGIWVYLAHFVTSIFIVYYIWVPFRAIIEYQHRYKIQQEAELLSKVDNLKQNFISLMSHDLKTPVAKIAGVADILRNQFENSNEQDQYLKSIVTSTQDLNKFITSILDLTKIESRNLKLDFVSRDINNIIEEVVKSLKFEAVNRKITFKTDLAPLYPISIDENLIHRVINNLVENAIKYSGEGTFIEIRSYDDEEFVFIEIKDDGVGISGKDVELIFDKFYRVKNDASHKIKGSGLGLYLVKYFIELHGGSIRVESEVGKGTTFFIKLKNA